MMDQPMFDDFAFWVSWGNQKGWITQPICTIHDKIPYSIDEQQALDEDMEVCCHVLKLNEAASMQLDECGHCGRPTEIGEQLIATRYNGLVCADCDENKSWKY